MNTSSQTISSQPHSFGSFQSPTSLQVNYSFDSSKPSSNSKSHHSQSPLQPLLLNTPSNFPLPYPNVFQKLQAASIQDQVALQSPSTKSSLQPSLNSPTIQKRFGYSSLEGLSDPKNSEDKKSAEQIKQKSTDFDPPESSKFPQTKKIEIEKEVDVSPTDPRSNEMLTEEIPPETQRDQENEVIQRSDHSMQEVTKLQPNHSVMEEEKVVEDQQQTEDQTNIPEDRQEDIEDGNGETHQSPVLYQAQTGSEKTLVNESESNRKASQEDLDLTRTRAFSMGESRISYESPKMVSLNKYSSVYLADELKKEFQSSDQNLLAVQTTKPKPTRQCLNIFCFTNPNDPLLWSKQKVMNSTICKSCFDAYKKGQHCFFCYQIYLDQETSASNDGKDWIECEKCNRWNHIECEMIHGLKEIQTLLQGHENTYKYYCPVCRNDKLAKAASKRLKSFMMASEPTLMKTTLTHKQTAKKQVKQVKAQVTLASENMMTEEMTVIEEQIEEPIVKKIRLNPELGTVGNSESFVQKVIPQREVPLSNCDLVKKKLDNVFLKTQANKKKLNMKPEQPHPEIHYEIEKLMIFYSGKRVQLTEQEIRADLELFKELSKTSTCHTEEKSNISEGCMELFVESTDEREKLEAMEELNGMPNGICRRKPSRSKTKEVYYNENYSRDDEINGMIDLFEQKKPLRNKKR